MLLLAVLLAAATAAGLVWRARQGRVRQVQDDDAAQDLTAEVTALGAVLGERATLLQFSSAFCAPCRATRTLLAHVAGTEPGVVHVEVDAEQHLELVRRLDVRKTPTTLVLDGRGREVRRASGAPRRADVLAALPS